MLSLLNPFGVGSDRCSPDGGARFAADQGGLLQQWDAVHNTRAYRSWRADLRTKRGRARPG